MDCEKCYEHQPKPMIKVKRASIHWVFPIQTDRKIKTNRPYTVFKDNERKPCLRIEMSEPTDINVSVKEYNIVNAKTWKDLWSSQ